MPKIEKLSQCSGSEAGSGRDVSEPTRPNTPESHQFDLADKGSSDHDKDAWNKFKRELQGFGGGYLPLTAMFVPSSPPEQPADMSSRSNSLPPDPGTPTCTPTSFSTPGTPQFDSNKAFSLSQETSPSQLSEISIDKGFENIRKPPAPAGPQSSSPAPIVKRVMEEWADAGNSAQLSKDDAITMILNGSIATAGHEDVGSEEKKTSSNGTREPKRKPSHSDREEAYPKRRRTRSHSLDR